MGTMKPRMAVRTGNTRSVAVKVPPAYHYGRFICAARIAASRSSPKTIPTVIPAYCPASSFTSCGVEVVGCAVTVTVAVGWGVGSAIVVAVGVGSGVGAGEVSPGVTTVTGFTLEIPHDVAE